MLEFLLGQASNTTVVNRDSEGAGTFRPLKKCPSNRGLRPGTGRSEASTTVVLKSWFLFRFQRSFRSARFLPELGSMSCFDRFPSTKRKVIFLSPICVATPYTRGASNAVVRTLRSLRSLHHWDRIGPRVCGAPENLIRSGNLEAERKERFHHGRRKQD
jgi:hypothetical protein